MRSAKTTQTSVLIAQDTTESMVPRQNVHTNQFKNSIMGEGPTSRESPYRVSCTFEALAKPKKKKMLLTKVV